MHAPGHCPSCGNDLIQKSRDGLFLVAIGLLLFSLVFFRFTHGLRFVVFTVGLIGCYFAAWGLIGHGRWCRQCKRFPTN